MVVVSNVIVFLVLAVIAGAVPALAEAEMLLPYTYLHGITTVQYYTSEPAPAETEMLSPYEQFQSGVPIEKIECSGGKALMLSSSGTPACVYYSTAQKLADRGWEYVSTQHTGKQDVDSLDSDTWNSQGQDYDDSYASSPGSGTPLSGTVTLDESLKFQSSSAAPAVDSIGFAAGGAQDIDNFRANIENGFLPLHTDITYEGLFYDYYFDTGSTQECKKLFCPSYSSAVSADPFSGNDEYYMSVGLNSGIKESDFERKNLNLVIVMDVSGSMNTPFDQYHYDSYGNPIPPEGDLIRSKMQIANEAVTGLLDHLTDDDRLGVVLFSNTAHVAKPLENMHDTNRDNLKRNILDITAGGGTNLSAGIVAGTSLFDVLPASERGDGYENRIIFLTDAMPNTGDTGKNGLFGIMEQNARNGIYSTVIGVGVDFNTELVKHITQVRGANYYSVHSSLEFQERMVDEFEFMVTPLVFDLVLHLDSEGYGITDVYGSPEADQATGQLVRINTLFPSKVSEGETRGGIVMIKLQKISDNDDDATITLTASYHDRDGRPDSSAVTISIDDKQHYDNTGIRKGIMLVRYAELMKNWIYDERRYAADSGDTADPSHLYDNGIHIPEYADNFLGQWERQSLPLSVSEGYSDAIDEFKEYFRDEVEAVGDDDLLEEVRIMSALGSGDTWNPLGSGDTWNP